MARFSCDGPDWYEQGEINRAENMRKCAEYEVRQQSSELSTLRARLAEREAWIQDAMVIFDKLAAAATACTCWPCCNGECLSNPWVDLRDLHEAAESLRKRAR